MGAEIQGKCWNCGLALGPHDYGREESCLGCRKPTRVCRNCRWFAPGRANDCEEPMAERVMEKERANFCGYFEPTSNVAGKGSDSKELDLQKAAQELFKY